MNIGKPRALGKKIEELTVGQAINVTEIIEDQQLLLYLGLTNDANPLYVQHDYAKETDFAAPIVPPVMLIGIVTSTISKHLPGAGSQLLDLTTKFINPVYHYQTVTFHFEIVEIHLNEKVVVIDVSAVNDQKEQVLSALATVKPPVVNKLV